MAARDALREDIISRLRSQIREHVRRGRSADEIDRLVLARDRGISPAERELGLLLARAEATSDVRQRYLAQVAESYD
jgi:predicted DNA-binding protein (UPF0278 family)